ncbi:DEAD/DEAH box helicase [Roseibium aquae]|uniref:DEAD/DEAH box helicase n=1 Tax=Roseibium aquae TaxID=1323746 RepID=A0A916TJN4_9HYPH|nr:DEAD/DEAH box helicase [Roseibium aquae]GGB48720.1 DEAD/DEAH box helicase [Roseibium aquae]
MNELTSLPQALQAALEKKGYETLTPVQQQVLSDAPGDADLLVSAQTGSGKTVAFGLALAPTLLDEADHFGPAGAPVALAITPTRELALQVKEELSWLYGEANAQLASCVGGMDPRMERRVLERGAHIVVGTPGRLRDHLERGALDLSQIKAVVLDEADEMLDMGFREDLEFILDAAPETRRTLMFSATVPKPIADLARRFQKDAVRLSSVSGKDQHGDIDYIAHPVAPNERENAIINVLRLHEAEKSIVFCSTREAVKRLTGRLANRGFAIVSLSGELSQEQRSAALTAMKTGTARVCVATDVAARGIDLPNLDLVIHADLPTGKAALLHRSGRTGRAGRKGTSVLMVPFPRRRAAERTLQFAGVKATWQSAPTADDIHAKDKERLFNASVLSEPLQEQERELAQELLARHDAESLAAAFVKLYQSRLPAAEDVTPASEDAMRGRDPGSRGGRVEEVKGKFEDGVWFRLSLGHKHRADPRWLLPMICRAGHVTKREVGAIKIYQNETHFEIAGTHGERYASTVKRDGTGEDNVNIALLDARGGKPPAPSAPRKPRNRHVDYEDMGREDRLDGQEAKRGRPQNAAPQRGKKRRRFDDEDVAPNHPAYEPLDMKALEGKTERMLKPQADGEKPANRGAPKSRKAAPKPTGKPPKKSKPKNKPSRAERKAGRTKP